LHHQEVRVDHQSADIRHPTAMPYADGIPRIHAGGLSEDRAEGYDEKSASVNDISADHRRGGFGARDQPRLSSSCHGSEGNVIGLARCRPSLSMRCGPA
jgi:hypothetical protein